MEPIFISYRRADDAEARDLHHLCTSWFGEGSSFLDSKRLEIGERWPDRLRDAVKKCRALIVVVSPDWLFKQDKWHQRCIDLDGDWCREELRLGLEEKRVILPILVRFTEMPPAEALPKCLADLASIQAIAKPESTWGSIIPELQARLERALGRAAQKAEFTEAALVAKEDILLHYRSWLREQHKRLIPYFEGASDYLLEDVCVEVDVLDQTVHRPGESAELQTQPKPAQPARFRDLLLAENRSGSAPRWFVEGEPGAGKTTLARSLAQSTAKDTARLALYVPLARAAKEKLDPLSYVVADSLGGDAACTARGRALLVELERVRKSGALFLLLDGLDEVDPQRLDACYAEILALIDSEAWSKTPIAVLTRPIAIERRDVPSSVRRAKVLALRIDQQDELLRKLLGADHAPGVRTHLQHRPALSELASSPLLLTLIAVVARDTVLAEQPLPANRSKLYETAIDLLLRRGFGIEKKGVRDTSHARHLMRRLSFELHEQCGEAWTVPQLSDEVTKIRRTDEEMNWLLKETWQTNDLFLDDIGGNSGILGPHDGRSLPWRYLHRSLREFLAAEEIESWPVQRMREHLGSWVEELQKEEREAQERERRSRRGKPVQPAPPESTKPKAARWGEVYALLCGKGRVTLDVLQSLQSASSEILLRLLPQIDWMSPRDGLTLALQTPGCDHQLLQRLRTQWQVSKEELERILLETVTDRASSEELGLRLCWLHELGTSFDADAFFELAGRPRSRIPNIHWKGIPAGSFLMGAPDDEEGSFDDERPQHRVTLRKFELASRPITVEQFRCFDSSPFGMPEPPRELLQHPAVQLSWWDAYAFCAWIGARLPSEAEWEYACRAGTTTRFWSGNSDADLERVAWYSQNSDGKKHPVAQKAPNAWGLYDMHGNVWEWCQDRGHRNYNGAPSEGWPSWEEGGSADRVIRGGSFANGARGCRSAARDGGPSGGRGDDLGFRPARFVT